MALSTTSKEQRTASACAIVGTRPSSTQRLAQLTSQRRAARAFLGSQTPWR
jgi:hypothetical protein